MVWLPEVMSMILDHPSPALPPGQPVVIAFVLFLMLTRVLIFVFVIVLVLVLVLVVIMLVAILVVFEIMLVLVCPLGLAEVSSSSLARRSAHLSEGRSLQLCRFALCHGLQLCSRLHMFYLCQAIGLIGRHPNRPRQHPHEQSPRHIHLR